MYVLYMFVFETNTAQKMKFSIKDLFSKCDQMVNSLNRSVDIQLRKQ